MRVQRYFVSMAIMRLFQVYKDQIKPDQATLLDAPGVSYSSTSSPYAVALIAHLPGELNRGGHAAYVDVLGDDGQLLSNPPLKIGWTWEGRQANEAAPPVALDKGPLDASAGNVVIYKGEVLSLWLQAGDRMVSDVVSGLQTAMPDADPATGNSRFHHSFYIVFRKRGTVVQPPTPQPVTLETLAADVAALKRRIAVLEAR